MLGSGVHRFLMAMKAIIDFRCEVVLGSVATHNRSLTNQCSDATTSTVFNQITRQETLVLGWHLIRHLGRFC